MVASHYSSTLKFIELFTFSNVCEAAAWLGACILSHIHYHTLHIQNILSVQKIFYFTVMTSLNLYQFGNV